MIYSLIVFSILCASFFVPLSPSLRVVQEVFYQVGGMCLLGSLFFYNIKPVKKSKVNIWLGIFAIYSCFLFMVNNSNGSAGTLINIFMGIILYFFALQIDKDKIGLYLKAVIFLCLINVIYIAFQAVDFDFIFNVRGPNNTVITDTFDPVGLLALKAVVGMWMGLGLVATLSVNPIIAFLFLIPIYMSESSGVIGGLVIALLFYFWFNRGELSRVFRVSGNKSYVIFVLCFLLAGSMYVIFKDSPAGMLGTRPPMWKMVLKDTIYGHGNHRVGRWSPILRNPLTGFGLDSFRNGPVRYFKENNSNKTIRMVFDDTGGIDIHGNRFFKKDGAVYSPEGVRLDWWDNPHNELVQLVYEMGFFGLTIIGFIFYYLYRRFEKALKTKELIVIASMMLFLLGASFTQFPAHLARIGFVIPILLAFYMTLTEE